MAKWQALRITIFNHKGGVGKSTITALLARELARVYHVAVLDLDAQTASSSGALGVDVNTAVLKYSVEDFVNGKGPVSTVLPPYVSGGRLQVIPITKSVGRSIQEYLTKRRMKMESLGSHAGIYRLLDQRLAEHLDDKFHFILMDCTPTSLSELMLQSLGAADEVLVPLELHQLGAGSIPDTREELQRVPRDGRVVRFLANKVKARSVEQREALDAVSRLAGAEFLQCSLPDSEAFGRATSAHEGIHRQSRFPDAMNAMQSLSAVYIEALEARMQALGCDPVEVENYIRSQRMPE